MINTPDSVMTSIVKIISNFFNPLISLFIFFIYRNLQEHSFLETLFLFAPIFLITILPITIWIVWNVKKGKYTNVDVSNRNQRKSLYFFVAGTLLAFLLYEYFYKDNLELIIIFVLILLLVLQMSNYVIKSSMHTAFNIFVAALFFTVNPLLGFVWFVIAIIVGITRIILKRHTPREVFAGGIIAILVSFIYLYTNIQFQQ